MKIEVLDKNKDEIYEALAPVRRAASGDDLGYFEKVRSEIRYADERLEQFGLIGSVISCDCRLHLETGNIHFRAPRKAMTVEITRDYGRWYLTDVFESVQQPDTWPKRDILITKKQYDFSIEQLTHDLGIVVVDEKEDSK